MNDYSIPVELKQARQQREDAWRKYNDLVDAGKQELANEFFPMVVSFEDRASRLYVEWMTQGGTSDIDSLRAVIEGMNKYNDFRQNID